MAATLLVVDLLLLAAGIPRERGEARERRESLTQSVTALVRDLPDLQRDSDRARQAIVDAMDAMDELLNLGRKSEGISAAQEKLEHGAQLMDTARVAIGGLPATTEEILRRASAGREDAASLKSLVRGPDVLYLEALANALELMLETHRIYSGMDDVLDRGFKVYEELFALTSDYLSKQRSGFFRSRKEAASWYTLRTEGFAAKIVEFRSELEAIRVRAEQAVVRAEKAFDEVEEQAGK